MCLSHSIRIDLSAASLQLVCVDEEGETQREKEIKEGDMDREEQRDGAPDSERRNQPDEHEEETQGRAERKADGAVRRQRRPASERTAVGRMRKNRKRAVATCSNSFGVSLEEARQKEGERQQNKSNQGIFHRGEMCGQNQ